MGGGRTYSISPLALAVHEERPRGQLVEDPSRLRLGHLPESGGRLRAVKGLMGRSGDELRLPLAEQDL